MLRNYRPPDSDSDDDYDGYYFDNHKPKTMTSSSFVQKTKEQILLDLVIDGNFEKLKAELSSTNIDINEPLSSHDNYNLLLCSTQYGHLDIARYLVEEKKAQVDCRSDSYTPLMLICENNHLSSELILKIGSLLLLHGADVNMTDKYGITAFFRACKNGHSDLVNLMLPNVFKETIDHDGRTALFYAIMSNKEDIVKLLISNGFDTSIIDKKGYSLVQVIRLYGFNDLLSLFPDDPENVLVPPYYFSYNKLSDIVPRLFLKNECPEYFQDVYAILNSKNLDMHLNTLANAKISLPQFLLLTDEDLKNLGINYPFQRKQLLKCILEFHLIHWDYRYISSVGKSDHEDHILLIIANTLQKLIVTTASVRFVINNLKRNELGKVSSETTKNIMTTYKMYRSKEAALIRSTKYLTSFRPAKNPLHIDYDEYLTNKKRRHRNYYLKCATIAAGISLLICFQMRKVLS